MGGYPGAGGSWGLMGKEFPRMLLPGIIKGGCDQRLGDRGAPGKRGIPTTATPGTRIAAVAARIQPIAHPDRCDGPEITWLSPEGAGESVLHLARRVLGVFPTLSTVIVSHLVQE